MEVLRWTGDRNVELEKRDKKAADVHECLLSLPLRLISKRLHCGLFCKEHSRPTMWPLLLSSSLGALLLSSGCNAALTTVKNWGTNPTGLVMEIYLPKTVAASPAVILAVRCPLSHGIDADAGLCDMLKDTYQRI